MGGSRIAEGVSKFVLKENVSRGGGVLVGGLGSVPRAILLGWELPEDRN